MMPIGRSSARLALRTVQPFRPAALQNVSGDVSFCFSSTLTMIFFVKCPGSDSVLHRQNLFQH